MAKEIVPDSRYIGQSARATIKNIIDAIVELTTNPDDNYSDIEQEGKKASGKIEISIDRLAKGACTYLRVRDYGTGMSRNALEKALEKFGSPTSSLYAGKISRGFWGKGLKEAILALGEGVITTIKNGVMHKTRVWSENKKFMYDEIMMDNYSTTKEPNGTLVDIKVLNSAMTVPTYKKFRENLVNHYALRDIHSSSKREVYLTFDDNVSGVKHTNKLQFVAPIGRTHLDKKVIEIPGYSKETLVLTLKEHVFPLTSPKGNSAGLAGILVKSSNSIMDNIMFGFEGHGNAAKHFFGEVRIEGIIERIRKGEDEVADMNRGGLRWEHKYCAAIWDVVHGNIKPFILNKVAALNKKPTKAVNASTDKVLRKLCNLLNELIKRELDIDGPGEPDKDISELTAVPNKVKILVNTPRTISIYAPESTTVIEGVTAKLTNDNRYIDSKSDTVILTKHTKYKGLWYGHFKVEGTVLNEKGNIIIILGSLTTTVNVGVVDVLPKGSPRAKYKPRRKGGAFSKIKPDETGARCGSSQRVHFDEPSGTIFINVTFPSVSPYIGSGLNGVETPGGRVLLSELVGEAFTKLIARRGIENGTYIGSPTANPIDIYSEALDTLKRRYYHVLQKLLKNWKP